MIEIKIPKEIKQYKATFVGGLSFRKTVSLGLGGIIVAYIAFNFKDAIPTDFLVLFSLLVGAPFGLIGFVNVYGMPFEKFVKVAFNDNLRSPKKRLYKVENIHQEIMNKYLDNENDTTEKKKKKKKKKKKYKKSKLAIK